VAGVCDTGLMGSQVGEDLIGRDHPAGVLRAEISRAVDSHGGLVLVTGEAGIGKTALVTGAAEEARRSVIARAGLADALAGRGASGDAAAAETLRQELLRETAALGMPQIVERLRRHAGTEADRRTATAVEGAADAPVAARCGGWATAAGSSTCPMPKGCATCTCC
jgi:hypothetical protein